MLLLKLTSQWSILQVILELMIKCFFFFYYYSMIYDVRLKFGKGKLLPKVNYYPQFTIKALQLKDFRYSNQKSENYLLVYTIVAKI